MAAFCLLGVTRAFAETPLEMLDHAVTDLKTQMEATAAKKAEAARTEKTEKAEKSPDEAEQAARLEMRGFNPLQGALQLLQQVREFLVMGRNDEALRTLQQLGAVSALPEEVRKEVDVVVQTLRKEQTDREEKYAREVDAACKHAGEILPKATEPKELDEPLQLLTRLSTQIPSRDYYNGGDNRLSGKLQAAIQFVNHWQDYLLAHSQNNEDAESSALRNLTDGSSYNQVPLVARSEILARIPPRESTSASRRSANRPARPQAQIDADAITVVQGVKKLDDLPGALARLVELRKEITSQTSYNFRSDSDLGIALTSLQALEKTFLEIQNGLATNISLGTNRNDYNARPDIENTLLPLRVQLIKMAAPRMLGASDEAKPAADEGLDAYLRRLIEAAKRRQDWAAVLRGLELKQTLATTTSGPYTTTNPVESEAFRSFFAGNNLETAGQYEQAVISYFTALRSGQTDLPAAVIGEHLAAIEKAHPKEYASSKELLLNPPRSPFGDPRANFPAGVFRNGFDPRFPGGRPGFPGQPSTDEKLAVPAASPSPMPSAAPTATPSPAP